MAKRRKFEVPKLATRKRLEDVGRKEQSAMEYLVTYGWAILLIAVVMSVLFYTSFSSTSLRAQPGACQVVRPLGPYTTLDINTEGECSNLLPEFVPSFGTSNFTGSTGNNGKGYGKISYPNFVQLPNINFALHNPNQANYNLYPPGFTITAWVYWSGPNNAPCQGIFGNDPTPSSGIALLGYGGNNGACGVLWINGSYVKWKNTSYAFNKNAWTFVAAVYNQSNGSAAVYTNMILFSNAVLTPRNFQTSNAFTLGAVIFANGDVYPTNGTVADVQLYNTPLSISELDAMYGLGLGGVPVQLQNLVGWWPMNGNANDYSGNGNNGASTNVTYSNSWYSSYTNP